MNDILHTIAAGLAEAPLLDRVNLVLGVLGVWLMARRNLWAFPVGLAAVSVQSVLFFKAKFYADSLLQVFFFGALLYGWRHWVRGARDEPGAELPVTTLSARGRVVTGVLALAGTLLWGFGARAWTDAPMPFRDAFIASFSVAAQVLQARKQIENWALWTAVNLVAIASYFSAALAFTAFLYGLFLLLGLLGWLAWARTLKRQSTGGLGGG